MAIFWNSNEIGRGNKAVIPISRQLWNATYFMTRILFAPFFRMNIDGAHFVPDNGGCILLPKHQCWQDIPLLGMAVGKPLYYVAKYELFDLSFARRLLQALGGIPLNRERPIQTRWSFRATVEVLKKGKTLVIFPEGTYFQNDMGDGRGGMLRFILNRVQVPLIPVGIQYFPGRLRREVCIRFGAPIKKSESATVLHEVMAEIASLSGLSPHRFRSSI